MSQPQSGSSSDVPQPAIRSVKIDFELSPKTQSVVATVSASNAVLFQTSMLIKKIASQAYAVNNPEVADGQGDKVIRIPFFYTEALRALRFDNGLSLTLPPREKIAAETVMASMAGREV